ncbi:PBP1A family penicillin-binding protein [Paenibacillus sp. sptzw28]|uniref:transglycosylase domain-containing protein n=1 Tax=Paenibacillus sp. sptzw28 TaxID=715179 RepID=UPI001C6E3C6A|nr:PBP1A family penicillin-binding protein [Paenibacillus sp. sptzw28]QYR19542.1 PBP1A family penicillin-binding protein [Paenibacillus sp. sptzw28]
MKPVINKRSNSGRAWNRIIISAILAASLLSLLAWAVFRLLVAGQDITRLDKPLPAATIIYDQKGKEATRISLNSFEPVSYDSLPKQLVDAVVAVEDKRFFEHDGMDIWGIIRALFTNLTNGRTVQGASTVTQQLAKNVFLSQERTWSRKWNEVLLAKKIEEHYSKPEIMEMYLNRIYFGEGAWGIKRAAAVYFGKPVNRLSLAESAMLAGIVKAPSALSPYKNPEKARERRNIVLQLMKEQGKISPDMFDKAVREPVKLQGSRPDRGEAVKYPYYVDQIVREASLKYGMTENEVLHGGLRIYTTLDTKMQQAAERVYAQEALFPESTADQLIQSGAVLVDPRDGGIKALIGGRGKQPFRGFNRAVQLKRQPGSTMKPISVYTPAFEQGYSPGDILLDEPINIGGYQPKNAGGAYHGEVSIYESIVHSYNVPAVRLLNDIGIDAGMEASERFGIRLTDADRTLGLALGGLQEGVSPLEMAEAFGAFANNGTRMPAHSIVRIESADDEILAEADHDAGLKVTEPSVAHTMTSVLQGVVREGTGEAAALPDRPVAGKTGTTEMPGSGGQGAKDNWFVGYTPQLVGAVWLGYDHTDGGHYLTTTSKAAAAVFQALMTEALKDEPVLAFPQSKAAQAGKDDERGNYDSKEEKWKPDKDRGKKDDDNKESGEDKHEKRKDKENGKKEGKGKD